jgi:hypothetical protein
MQRAVRRLALCALLGVFGTAAEAAPILVSADATVAGGFLPNLNLGNSGVRGGLLSGTDASALSGPYRFYLMFQLPAFAPDTFISSATLQGFYNDDWDTFDDRTHSIYQSPTTWTESTINWNNQPGPIGAPVATFDAARATPGTYQSWDVTAAANTVYLERMLLLSFLFRADDESRAMLPVLNHSLEYFASREFEQGARAFTLDVQVAAVPEPASLLLLSTGLAAAIRLRRGRRG